MFADVEEDTIRHSQQNGNSQTSLTVGTSLIKPEPINKKGNSNDPLLDLKRNIPSRLLKNNKTSLSVPARIISVDADKRLGYIIFDDSITVVSEPCTFIRFYCRNSTVAGCLKKVIGPLTICLISPY